LPEPTNTFKDQLTNGVLNPFPELVDRLPVVAGLRRSSSALAVIIGSRRAAIGGSRVPGTDWSAAGLWADAMSTLAATLAATTVVMVLGLVLGVWMGRSQGVDRVLRPVLDAAQTMPAFVYLVPFVALFAASRFTAIVAAVVFAAPVTIKIIADGSRGCRRRRLRRPQPPGPARGRSSPRSQLPMSVRTIALATNQGLIYVLSMVVVGRACRRRRPGI